MGITVILIILVSSSFCQAMVTDQGGGVQKKTNKFVVRYPPNVCSTGALENCLSNLPGKFTIHGLWPNEVSKPLPRTFNINLLQGQLLSDLQDLWPGLENSSTRNEDLWSHEWLKHGPYFQVGSGSQVEYFQYGVDLLRIQVIQEALSALLIQGKKYVTVDILKELKDITNFTPALSCKNSGQGSTTLLIEITFCLESTLKTLTDCPAKQSGSGCEPEFYVKK